MIPKSKLSDLVAGAVRGSRARAIREATRSTIARPKSRIGEFILTISLRHCSRHRSLSPSRYRGPASGVGKSGLLHSQLRRASPMSCWTIILTSSGKVTCGSQPSISRALVSIPAKRVDLGRTEYHGSISTWHRQSSPAAANASSNKLAHTVRFAGRNNVVVGSAAAALTTWL